MLTVLRHPIEKLFSATIYFASAKVEHKSLRHIMNDTRGQSFAMLQAVILQVANASFPTELGLHQGIDVLADREWDTTVDYAAGFNVSRANMFVARGRNRSVVRATRATAGSAHLDAKGFNHAHVTLQDAKTAARVLRRDFVVGVTERLDRFLALASVELRWSLAQLWCVALRVLVLRYS
jgi:hypothetical protein